MHYVQFWWPRWTYGWQGVYLLFHYIQSMDRHIKQQIKPKLHEWHKTLCYECKNATSLEEVDVWYATIRCCLYSLGIVDEVGLQELEN
jgi:hypothetical protein